MSNLETIGLLFLLGLILFGGGLIFKYTQPPNPKKRLPTNSQVPDDKFETAAEFHPEFQFPLEPVREYVPELSWGYDDDKCTIMARDPEYIFAYWDISEKRRDSLKGIYGEKWDQALPVLRVYDITKIANFNGNNANHYFDVVINDYAGKWYVHVGADRDYCVDLGRVLKDGSFVVIARSNVASTPRNTVSNVVDPDWMLVSENERKLLARMGHFEGYSSAELFDHSKN